MNSGRVIFPLYKNCIFVSIWFSETALLPASVDALFFQRLWTHSFWARRESAYNHSKLCYHSKQHWSISAVPDIYRYDQTWLFDSSNCFWAFLTFLKSLATYIDLLRRQRLLPLQSSIKQIKWIFILGRYESVLFVCHKSRTSRKVIHFPASFSLETSNSQC